MSKLTPVNKFFSYKNVIVIGTLSILMLFSFFVSSEPDLNALFLKPSKEHWLGTTLLGQDILASLLVGIRYSLLLSATTVLISALLGTCLSLISIYQKYLSTLTLLLSSILIALPPFIICLLLISRWKANTQILIIGQLLAFLPVFIRLSYRDLKKTMQSEFVQTALHLGNHPIYVGFKHGLTILSPKLKAQILSLISVSIGIESGLSYLGIGPPLPHSSLGTMIYTSSRYWSIAPWYPISSFLCFFMLISAIAWISYKPQT